MLNNLIEELRVSEDEGEPSEGLDEASLQVRELDDFTFLLKRAKLGSLEGDIKKAFTKYVVHLKKSGWNSQEKRFTRDITGDLREGLNKIGSVIGRLSAVSR